MKTGKKSIERTARTQKRTDIATAAKAEESSCHVTATMTVSMIMVRVLQPGATTTAARLLVRVYHRDSSIFRPTIMDWSCSEGQGTLKVPHEAGAPGSQSKPLSTSVSNKSNSSSIQHTHSRYRQDAPRTVLVGAGH